MRAGWPFTITLTEGIRFHTDEGTITLVPAFESDLRTPRNIASDGSGNGPRAAQAPASDVAGSEESERRGASATLRAARGWLGSSIERRRLVDALSSLGGWFARACEDDHSLLEALQIALVERRLLAHIDNHRLPAPILHAPEPPPSSDPRPPVTTETTWFQVRFVDEVGTAIDGLDITFSVLGSPRKATTNGAGVARLEGETVSSANVTVPSTGQLRDILHPRWTEPRAPKIPTGPNVLVREIDVVFDPVGLDAETPTTVVIKPYFRCREIPGAHFEFGRSFVRRDAIASLASIAEDLSGEPFRRAMIFAHTDKTGPDALNKELSERRAKAAFALLTHDAAAWEELWTNQWSGGNWSEQWGTREVQHMLNALHVATKSGSPLPENGILDTVTKQAIQSFQRGDYPDKPAEQAPLADDGIIGPLTRKELFFSYAKRVTRLPLAPDRLSRINGEPYMGCGEYNPLSLSTKDAESRRVVLLVFDVAAEPQALPCKLRSLAPCKANIGPEATEVDPAGKPPYRCKVYQAIAALCPCQGGADLSHDLIVQIPRTLKEANGMPHVFILENEDGTITQTRALATDARAHDLGFVEIYFPDLPPMHSYRLRCEGIPEPYIVFDWTPYEALSSLGPEIFLDSTRSWGTEPPVVPRD